MDQIKRVRKRRGKSRANDPQPMIQKFTVSNTKFQIPTTKYQIHNPKYKMNHPKEKKEGGKE